MSEAEQQKALSLIEQFKAKIPPLEKEIGEISAKINELDHGYPGPFTEAGKRQPIGLAFVTSVNTTLLLAQRTLLVFDLVNAKRDIATLENYLNGVQLPENFDQLLAEAKGAEELATVNRRRLEKMAEEQLRAKKLLG